MAEYTIDRTSQEIRDARVKLLSSGERLKRSGTTGHPECDTFIEETRSFGMNLTCPVCKSLMKSAKWTPCLHALCEICCNGLFADTVKAKCPTCRKSFTLQQTRKNETVSNLTALFLKLQARNPESASDTSQVFGFSQMAKDMLDCSCVVEDAGNPLATPSGESARVASIPPSSMPPAVETNVGSVFLTTSNKIGEPKSEIPERRFIAVPKFNLDTPVSLTKPSLLAAEGTVTPRETPPGQYGFPQFLNQISSGSSTGPKLGFMDTPLAAATPFKVQATTTTTPPTIKLETMPKAALASTTPEQLIETKTPPTIKLDEGRSAPLNFGSSSVVEPGTVQKSIDGDTAWNMAVSAPCGEEQPKPVQNFRKGQIVTVARRMGPGQNKPGGVGKITKVNEDGTIDVYYTVEGKREKRVPIEIVNVGINVEADSLFGKPNLEVDDEDDDEKEAKAAPVSASKRMKQDKDTSRQLSFSSAGSPSPPRGVVVVVLTGDFSSKVKHTMTNEVKNLGGEVIDNPSINDWARISHVISSISVERDGRIVALKRSAKILSALSLGLWIVSPEWLKASKGKGSWVDERSFEIDLDASAMLNNLEAKGPLKSRETAIKFRETGDERLLLFHRHYVAFVGKFDLDMDLSYLAKTCGAKMYNSADVEWNSFDANKFIQECPSGYRALVICQVGDTAQRRKSSKNVNFAKLDNENLQMVSLNWFLDCLSTHSILDVSRYRIMPDRAKT